MDRYLAERSKKQRRRMTNAKQSCYVVLDDYLSVLHLDILENNWKFKLTTVYWRQDRKGAGIWPKSRKVKKK